MRSRVSCLVLAAPLCLSACGSADLLAPPSGLPHAAASRSCAPTDGPAVAIYLAPTSISALEPAPPYVRLQVWKPVNEIVGKWSLSPGSADGSAAHFRPAGSIESAARGTVVVLAIGADSTVTGNVDLIFPSIGHVRGGFSARWVSRTFLCG